MARNTSTDDITLRCINRYVPILKLLTGWGLLNGNVPAVYAGLGLPFPQEPFPAAYIYLAAQRHARPSTGIRYDYLTITVRIIGGPVTPTYKFDAEDKVYSMITGVKNELFYRQYLEDPTSNNAPFDLILPEEKMTIKDTGRIQVFQYPPQGGFIGYEVPTTVGLNIKVGRLS